MVSHPKRFSVSLIKMKTFSYYDNTIIILKTIHMIQWYYLMSGPYSVFSNYPQKILILHFFLFNPEINQALYIDLWIGFPWPPFLKVISLLKNQVDSPLSQLTLQMHTSLFIYKKITKRESKEGKQRKGEREEMYHFCLSQFFSWYVALL